MPTYKPEDHCSYEDSRRHHERYVGWIKENEALARISPDALKRRIVRYLALGISILALMLLGSIVLVSYSCFRLREGTDGPWLYLGLGGLAICYSMVSSLFFKHKDEDKRLELKRADAPALFRIIDELRGELKVPAIHRVEINDEFNATAGQRPKYGFIGPYVNTLTLGLPYMLAHGVPELRSTITHELGHFAGAHGAFTHKIYRFSLTWWYMWNSLGSGRPAAFLIYTFLNWYMPRLEAMTHALVRAHEYDADAANRHTGTVDDAARKFVRWFVSWNYYYFRFWQEIDELKIEMPEPPQDVMSRLGEKFKQPADPQIAEKWLKEGLARETGHEDTHPSVAERLRSIERLPCIDDPNVLSALVEEITAPIGESSAEALLGPSYERVLDHFSKEWHDEQKKTWNAQHEARKHLSQCPRSIEDTASDTQLLKAEAERLSKLGKRREYDECLRRIIEIDPDHAWANYTLGSRLYGEGDPSFVGYLERAAHDPRYIATVPSFLYEHFQNKGDHEKAARYFQQMKEGREVGAKLRNELDALHKGPLLPLHLDAPVKNALAASLADKDEVLEAYVAKRPTSIGEEYDLLIIVPKPAKAFSNEYRYVWELRENLAKSFNDYVVCVIPQSYAAMRHRLKELQAHRVYVRQKTHP